MSTIWQYVKGHYDGDTGHVNIWCRSDKGEKKMFRVTGFDPYFYVDQNESVPENAFWLKNIIPGFVSNEGINLKRLVTNTPLDVDNNRSKFSRHWEADIEFVERMLIDTGITSSFEYDGTSSLLPALSIKPSKIILQPLVVFMDIETKTQGVRFPNKNKPTQPIICVTFWDTQSKQYITFVVDDRYKVTTVKQREPNWKVVHLPDYVFLVDYIQKYFAYLKPDIVTGWNIRFDTEYFDAWAKKTFDRSVDWSPTEIFDLHKAYTKTRPNLGNRLKEVVIREGVIKQEDMVSESFRIADYIDPRKRDDFILYNKKDVEYCVQLDRGFIDIKQQEYKEYRFIQAFWGEKNFVGLHDINYTLEHIKRHDCLWLRKAHELGIVLPSSPEEQSEEDIEYGGVVFTPPAKIYPDLSVLDMSRYYPSILRSYPKETSPDIWGKLGPDVINYLLAERDVWDKELLKQTPGSTQWKAVKDTRDKVKAFLSGAWGYFAFKGSRIFSKARADFVLKTAGDGLKRLRTRSESLLFKVIYGDTDSIFINVSMDKVSLLETAMNEELQMWADENGIGETAKFKIKEDRYASQTLFIKKKGSDTGAKKRYAQRIIREDNRACDYVLIKGFDYVRGNTSEVTRKLQKECIEMVLAGKAQEFIKQLGQLMMDIKGNKYDIDQITIPVNLSKDFLKQDAGGEYYTGAVWANKYLKEEIVPGDLVKYFQVKRVNRGDWEPTNWCSYLDKQNLVGKGIDIDYDWVISRTVRSPLERILESVGISWENVEGFQNLNEWFS